MELAEWMERHAAKVSYEARGGTFYATVEITGPAATIRAQADQPIHAMTQAMLAAYEATGDWS